MNLSTKDKIRLASLAFRLVSACRKICGKAETGQFQRRGFTWDLDLREVVDFMIYLTGSFEGYLSDFVAKNTKEGDILMDIGANVGAHTLTMGRVVGTTGMVYAIEATDYAYKKLCRNIELNPEIRPSIKPFHCLFTSEDGTRPTSICSSWPFQSKEDRHPLHQGVGKTVGEASRISLDAFIETHKIEQLDLIKIDVDGNEWDVLSEAGKTLGQLQPLILMELAPGYNHTDSKESFSNLHSLLQGHGYHFYDFEGNVLPDNACQLAASIPEGASRNVVLVHQDQDLPIFLK